jgi:hypothetical protein
MRIQEPGISAPSLRVALLCALCAAWPHALAAPAEPASPGAKGASGAVLKYEEGPGPRILYHEAKGGILVPVAPPIPGSARDAMPPVESVGRGRAAVPRPAAKPADAAKERKEGP